MVRTTQRSTGRMLAERVALLMLSSAVANAGESTCGTLGKSEELHYSWKLRGPFTRLASVALTTEGFGRLRTVSPRENVVEAEVRFSGESDKDGFYLFQSQFEEDAARTLMTYGGYARRDKRRSERTFFDYPASLARIRKENSGKVEAKESKIPNDTVRDILTGIYLLRRNAGQIQAPRTIEIYSRGKFYPVMIQPLGTEPLVLNGQTIQTRKFEITAPPGKEKEFSWSIRIWLSDDDSHVPLRFKIKGDLAAIQVDLHSISSCSQPLFDRPMLVASNQ